MAKKAVVAKKAVKKAAPKSAPKAKPKAEVKPVKKTTALAEKKTVNSKLKSAALKRTEIKKAGKDTPIKKASSKAAPITKALKPKKVEPVAKPKKAEPVVKPKKVEAVAQPAVPAPVKQKAPLKKYSKDELEKFKVIILEKQSEAIANLQTFRDQMLDPSTGEYINENSPYSLHMAEQGTDAMEKEKTYFYAQREQKLLGYLEEALKRIEAGTYGLCIDCMDDPKMLCPTCPLIPRERLEAVPHSQLCAQIKKMQEKPRR